MAEMDEQKQKQLAAAAADDSPSPLRLILSMGGIGLVSGVLIVMTFQFTLPFIIANREAALEKAIVEVLPGATTQRPFNAVDGKLEPATMDSPAAKKYYVGYDENGGIVGVALQASGQGFQDTISLLYGYSPAKNAVIGFKVLESKETPGLGDKIISDAKFLANFEALHVEVNEAETGVVHPIKMVKAGEKNSPWEVEAITGATISSRAVSKILAADTQESVPIIERSLQLLEKGAADATD